MSTVTEKRREAFREFYCRTYRPEIIKRKWQKPVSCSSFHSSRSAYHQHQQLALLDETLSDVEIMDNILEHAMPCLSCTTVPLYPKANLFRPNAPNYVVSRHALDAWCPQNHMDCAAAALAGAVSAALGRKRGELDYIETMDVVTTMKRMAERDIATRLEKLMGACEFLDWHLAQKSITKLIRHRKQPTKGDVRFQDFNKTAMFVEWKKTIGSNTDLYAVLSSDRIADLVFHLCKLYALEVMASHRSYESVVQEMGLGLTMHYRSDYTWEELKEFVGQAGCGVVAFVPQHLVVVFATGEDEQGQHRHVLIGRISGGQSPCSWIPFSQEDLMEDETGWVDLISPDGPGELPNPSTYKPSDFITMTSCGSPRLIGIVKAAKKPQQPIPHPIPSWLLRDDVCCNSCMVDSGAGDTPRRDSERREWLNL